MKEATLTMNTRAEIPIIGLGVYKSRPGATTRDAVRTAFEAGYRLVDTAAIYQNELDVGAAVAASGLAREELFITTKLWNADHGYDNTLAAFDDSLGLLGLGYVDLYLIHWPVENIRRETWKAMERLTLDGRVRAIGVSNYMAHHLEELLAGAVVKPAVNQIELSPFNYRSRLATVELCRQNSIVVEAYSPLTKGRKLSDPTVGEIGSRHGKSPAQILIRWSIQHGFVVLPKSVTPARIRENIDVFDFELSEAEMERLDDLDQGLVTGWDPTTAP
jgi:diketogulonate reductase-like aldo/keto reductase